MKFSLSHLFIPQERNNHRAALLRVETLIVLILFYLINQSFIKFVAVLKPGVLGYSSEITAQKVLSQTNQERQEIGLAPLQYNSTLSQSATLKAQDMFTSNYWAHNSPSGKIPWDFFKQVGYKYSLAGENLARDFYDTNSLLKAWMNSPTHKANIVNQEYEEIGIGVVNGTLGGVKTTLVVQHFGTPLVATLNNNNQKTSQEEIVSPQTEVVPDLVIESEETIAQNSKILSGESKYINPLLVSKTVGIILFAVIISVLFIDGYVTLKNNHHRLTGSTVGHIAFLLVILFLMLSSQQGVIF